MNSHENQSYDIVILGGGITGAGIARDAALRGLRVALVEKGDWGSGTSSKSSKLIHGGLRYLEHGEIPLVFESVSERSVQMKMAPHLVRPLPFLLPIYPNHRYGIEMMNIGLWIYDALALFRSPKLHKTYRGKKARDKEPLLLSEELKGAISYYDCFTDDARLVLENVVAAAEAGADCRSYTAITGVERNKAGRVRGVMVKDQLTGAAQRLSTHALIVAAGPWTDRALATVEENKRRKLLKPTKGVHIVFPHEQLPIKQAVTVLSPVDGRVMFAIPWRDRLVLGTTDTFFDGDPDEVHATMADVKYLCESGNHFFPSANLKPEDVISTWAGLRPLIHEDADSASDVSREHQVNIGEDGVHWVAGGKLTTYRIMADEIIDKSVVWLRDYYPSIFDGRPLVKEQTKTRLLPGGRGLSSPDEAGLEALAQTLVTEHIDEEIARHLAFTFGSRASILAEFVARRPILGKRIVDDLPHIWAEVLYACEHEHVKTADDVLSRRIPLLLTDRDQGLSVLDEVIAVMQPLLGWDPEETLSQSERYRQSVEESRRFRSQ